MELGFRRCVAVSDSTRILHRDRNTTREIFVESLISIKAQAEQALARQVDCSVLSVPDYLDDFDREAVAAAAFDVGFESVQIMRSSEAVHLAYDFGECGGEYPSIPETGVLSDCSHLDYLVTERCI